MGGTGYNLSANLAALGAEVVFMTAVGPSPFSRLILETLEKNGVSVQAVTDPTLPIAGFVAHILGGEMLSAVSAMPIDRVKFEHARVEQLVSAASALIVDCNLSRGTVLELTELARATQVPYYLAAVSQEKSTRAIGATDGCSGFFMNREEAAYLAERVGFESSPVDNPREFSQLLGCPVVITLDKDGALYASGEHSIKLAAHDRPLQEGNFLGCGDYVMASTVLALEQGKTPTVALHEAQAGLWGHTTKKNCNAHHHNAMDNCLAEIETQARVDELTGLPNRRTVSQALSRRIHRKVARGEAGGVCVVLFDVDHFKSVNDQWGHDAGDKVLRSLADVASEVIRPEDVLGRWGGEEFLWVMNCTEGEGAIAAERLRNAIMTRVEGPRQITASLGVAELGVSEDAVALVDRADAALYYGKRNGRNRVTAASQVTQ